MLTILDLAEKISGYLDEGQVRQVVRAYYYAEQAHEGQMRRSGEPYVTHPLSVAAILSDMRLDHQSLMAAMLHDVIEDTGVCKSDLEQQFGSAVAELVDGVSKLTQMEFRSKAEAQAENFQKMTMAMAKDIRVILVKLADRLHNMRTLGVMRPEKRRRIAKETLEIYAPIANRLGINTLRVELEDLCFFAMHSMRARRIQAALSSIHKKRDVLIEETRQIIASHLDSVKIKADVQGREKHLYSIYQKMRSSRKSFSAIMDMFGFRILVDNVDSCYRVLGAMHALYKPISSQFKDYIAIPKSNGYQSLHTILIGMHGVPIEVQIRTHEMDEMANNGIAAHWLYKQESDTPSSQYSSTDKRARQWVQGLLEIQETTGDSLEFIENVKIDLFPDEVYVFTPRGKILELPHGATAVDFAYAVHTDLGDRCVGCYINRKLSSLNQPLESGATVEIITSSTGQPNPAWLDFVVTGKARSNIRHALKNQRHSESIELGRRLLNRALDGMDSRLEDVNQENLDALLTTTGHSDLEYLLEDIGIGNRAAFLTAQQLTQGHVDDTAKNKQNKQSLTISGTEGMVINFAKCCHPIPGDNIIGYMSAGRGVVVHDSNCSQAQDILKKPEKAVELRWADDIKGEFLVPLCLEIKLQRGMVAAIATTVNRLDGFIESINVIDKDAHTSRVDVELYVQNRVHLARIMKQLRNNKSVTHIERVKATRKKKRTLL